MKRKLEMITGIVGAVIVTLSLGGFTLITKELDKATYIKVFKPIFGKDLNGTDAQGMELMKTLGAWFGFTVMIVLVLVVLATVFIRNNRSPKLAALFYALAGLATLIGSQNIAYPVAFIFFVVTALCVLRKVETPNVPDKNN